ncbi:MAG: phosphatidylglycerophosphatase A [Deltaproteobacteria bacterium]|nr:phosphatidylglycerophosphatase A [Deltaproteobacteria bacterium]
MLHRLTKRLEPFKPFRIVRLAYVTGLYSGYVPIAPGTAGSAVGLVIAWYLFPHLNGFSQTLFTLVLTLLGIWLSDSARRHFKKEDPGQIVIDEIVGILFTMIGIPITTGFAAFGFILFRILDIVKPPPASYFDSRLKNGWGIVLDDVVSGIYANIILHLIVATQI